MGRTNNTGKSFTNDDVDNKDLVIKMLQFEEQFTKSDRGQALYKNKLNRPFISLTVEKTINRIVLAQFGYNTTDDDVETYRTIFRTYFRSPDDYDEDVINSVHYMRENRCVFYKATPLQIGEQVPDSTLYHLNGKNKTSLYNIIDKKSRYTVIAAFSLS